MDTLSWLQRSAASQEKVRLVLTALLVAVVLLFAVLSSRIEQTPVTASTLAATARTCWPSRRIEQQERLVAEDLCSARTVDMHALANPLHFFYAYDTKHLVQRGRRILLTCNAFCQDEEVELARYVVEYQQDTRRDIPYWKGTMRHLLSPLTPEEAADPLNDRALFFDLSPYFADLQTEMEEYLRTKAEVGMLPEEYRHVAKEWREALRYKALHPTPNATDPMWQLAERVEQQLAAQPWLLQRRAVVAQAAQLYERHVLRVVLTRSLQVSSQYAASHPGDLVASVQQYVLQLWELTTRRIRGDAHRAPPLLPDLPALEGVSDFPYPRLKQPIPIIVTLHYTEECLLCDLYHQTFDMLPYLYKRMCASAGHTIIECNPLVVFLRVPETHRMHIVPRVAFRKGPRLYSGNASTSAYPGLLGAVLQEALEEEDDESDSVLGLRSNMMLRGKDLVVLSQNPTLLDVASAVMDGLVSAKAIRFRVLSDKQVREMHEHNARLDRRRKEQEQQRHLLELMRRMQQDPLSRSGAVLDALTWFESDAKLSDMFSLSANEARLAAEYHKRKRQTKQDAAADVGQDDAAEQEDAARRLEEQEVPLDKQKKNNDDDDEEEEEKQKEQEYFQFTTVGEYLGGDVRRSMLLLSANISANLHEWADYNKNVLDRFERIRQEKRRQRQLLRRTPLLHRVWRSVKSNLLVVFFLFVFLFQLLWNMHNGTSIW